MSAALTNQSTDSAQPQSLSGVAIIPMLCGLLVFFAAFMNSVDIDHSEPVTGAEKIKVDWLVAIKLAIAGASGLIGAAGVLFSWRVRATLLSGPGPLLLALAGTLIATSMFAIPEVVNVARGVALMFLGYLMFIPTALAVLGLRRIMVLAFIAMAINLLIGWWLYLFVPAQGVFEESFGEQFFFSRMGGLGHPNAVGRTGVLCALLGVCLLRDRSFPVRNPGVRMLVLAAIGLGLLTCISTFSRTAAMAGMAGAIFLMWDKVCSKAGMAWVMGGVMLVLGGAITLALVSGGELGHSLLSMTTKTGEVEELMSATGRTDIWAEAVRLILQRPLTGWGLNSAPVMMEDFSRHTHNLVLHAAFSGGLVAAALVLCLLLWNLVVGVTSAEPLVRTISIYVLVSGLFEDTVLDTFSSTATILWILVILYPAMSGLSKVDAVPARRASV